ncbi:hypothetical protein ABH937_006371 [Kitasatospora sp. GAS1066B]
MCRQFPTVCLAKSPALDSMAAALSLPANGTSQQRLARVIRKFGIVGTHMRGVEYIENQKHPSDRHLSGAEASGAPRFRFEDHVPAGPEGGGCLRRSRAGGVRSRSVSRGVGGYWTGVATGTGCASAFGK